MNKDITGDNSEPMRIDGEGVLPTLSQATRYGIIDLPGIPAQLFELPSNHLLEPSEGVRTLTSNRMKPLPTIARKDNISSSSPLVLRNKMGNGPAKAKGKVGTDDNKDPFKGVTLDSVGGLKSQISWLKRNILQPLKSGDQDQGMTAASFGIKPPKGVLFHGPPGCGKTLLARAFGNELGKQLDKPVTFYHRKGGDCFSMWFGESSENLKILFDEAIAEKPSVIFFDELDGLCPNRDGVGSSEGYRTVVTCLLGLMDTLPQGEVFVIGATNRLDAVDPAMLRPGRFDKHLEFFPPDKNGRKEILSINTAKWKEHSKLTEEELESLSQKTEGFTGADLENLCREAFFTAVDRHIPDLDRGDATLDGLKVLNQDWATALKKTKPTNTAIFGSSLYTPVLPNKLITPLIENVQKEIVAKLVPHLPTRSALDEDHNNHKIVTNAFLLYTANSASIYTLNSIILPGVFFHEQLSPLPVYHLCQVKIHSHHHNNHKLNHITEVINQAKNSTVPCILFVPRLDDLVHDLEDMAPMILKQLKELRGKPVLLLATSSSAPTTTNPVWGLFGYDMALDVRKPTREERALFFRHAFEVKGGDSEENLREMEALLEKCVEVTHGDSVHLLLALSDTIHRISAKRSKTFNQARISAEIETTLKSYGVNKKRY